MELPSEDLFIKEPKKENGWKNWLPLIVAVVALAAIVVIYMVYNAKNSGDRPISSISQTLKMSADELQGDKAEYKKVLIKKAGDQDSVFWIYDSKTDFSVDKAVLVFINFFLEAKLHKENDIASLHDGQQITIKGVFKKTMNPEDIYTFWKIPVPDAEAAGRHGIYLEAESAELVK